MTIEPDFWAVTWKFDGEAFEALRRTAEELTYQAKQVIFTEGDEADGMYLVLEGYALVVGEDGDDGKRETLSIIPEGQSFGELALLIRQPRLATVQAGTALKVLKVPAETLENLEESDSHAAAILYKKLAVTLAEQLVVRGDPRQSKNK